MNGADAANPHSDEPRGESRASEERRGEERRGQEPRGDDRRLARSAARLAAVQALYQMELTGEAAAAVASEFESHRIGAEIEGAQYREADIAHFRAVLRGVVERQREIDQMTDEALVERWPLGKIDPTLRAIFRCGGFELLGMDAVPPKVAITEYVDVAKAFFTEGQEARFVNAVLDHMARKARPEAFAAR
ncbi:MAG: transcription antitermination factor NusB [Pseudomonadota bacterium]